MKAKFHRTYDAPLCDIGVNENPRKNGCCNNTSIVICDGKNICKEHFLNLVKNKYPKYIDMAWQLIGENELLKFENYLKEEQKKSKINKN